MKVARIRPTILLAVVSLGLMGTLSLYLGQAEVTTAAITGIVGLAAKIMDSEEAMDGRPNE